VQGGFSVDVRTENGTAESPSDYTSLIQTVHFEGNAGESENVTVSTLPDSNSEGNEEFWVVMDNLSRALPIDISDNASIKITESAAVTIDNVTTSESNSFVTAFLKLDNPVAGGFTVFVSTEDGSATAGNDYYSLTQSSVYFNGTAGEEKTVTIYLISNSDYEPTEEFTVKIDSVTGNSSPVDITDNGTIILNDDDPVTIAQYGSSYISISENATNGFVEVPITLTVSIPDPFTVYLKTDNGTAFSGQDFTALDNFTFPANTLTANIEIPIDNDSRVEGREYFYVSLLGTDIPTTVKVNSSPMNRLIYIDDDDQLDYTVSRSNLVVSENGSIKDNFTIVLNNKSKPDFGKIVSIYLYRDNISTNQMLFESNVTNNYEYANVDFQPTVISFSSDNYSIPQAVIFEGIEDGYDDDNTTLRIMVYTSATNNSGGYLAWPTISKYVDVVSIDSGKISQEASLKGYEITQTDGTTTVEEGGSTDELIFKLINNDSSFTPSSTSYVNFTLATSDNLSISPDFLQFTQSDWNSEKTVTISSGEDSAIEGDHYREISISASSNNTEYNKLNSSIMKVLIKDND